MYDYHNLEKWKEQYRTLDHLSVSCPACEVSVSTSPVQVDGIALDAKNSTEETLHYEIGKYPAFVPQFWGGSETGIAVVRCNSCSVYMVVEIPAFVSADQPIRAVWPLAGVQVSEDIPEPVRLAVEDAKKAHAVDSKTGAVMSARTAVERIQRTEEVDSISELWAKKELPPSLFDTANEPRLWGNLIAHKDFDPKEVTSEQVGDLLGSVKKSV